MLSDEKFSEFDPGLFSAESRLQVKSDKQTNKQKQEKANKQADDKFIQFDLGLLSAESRLEVKQITLHIEKHYGLSDKIINQ